MAHRLPGQRSSTPSWEDGNAEFVCYLDNSLYVAFVSWEHDANGLDLIHRGVRGVQQAGKTVKPHLSLDSLLQFQGNFPIFL